MLFIMTSNTSAETPLSTGFQNFQEIPPGSARIKRRKNIILHITALLSAIFIISSSALLLLLRHAFLDREFLESLAEELQNRIYRKLSMFSMLNATEAEFMKL